VTSHHRRTHDTSEILISRVEHHAVSDAAEKMARDHDDVSVGYIDVDADGVVDLDSLMSRLSDDTAIVTSWRPTTKPGFEQPLDGVSALSKSIIPGWRDHPHRRHRGRPSWVNLATVTATTDMISICAHKIGGPVTPAPCLAR